MSAEREAEERDERIEQPVSEEARRETRMTPAEAVEAMRIRVPVRGNRKLRALVDRVNDDRQLKGWWHVANVNAVLRMEINDHSWVHIQIVTNIALKLLRQLVKHGVEPTTVRDYGFEPEDAEVIVVLGALLHCVGMAVHRDGQSAPIGIEIRMNNSSGIYQVDGLLKAKLRGSGLEPYVEVTAHIDTEAEKRLVPVYRLET